jgi:hypothetical protein
MSEESEAIQAALMLAQMMNAESNMIQQNVTMPTTTEYRGRHGEQEVQSEKRIEGVAKVNPHDMLQDFQKVVRQLHETGQIPKEESRLNVAPPPLIPMPEGAPSSDELITNLHKPQNVNPPPLHQNTYIQPQQQPQQQVYEALEVFDLPEGGSPTFMQKQIICGILEIKKSIAFINKRLAKLDK